MKHFWRTGLLAFVAAGCYAGAIAAQDGVDGDPAAGRIKASTCLGCHGVANYSNVYPTYHVPKLGGQRAEYLVSVLRAYKAGEREHSTMRAQAGSLSEQDIRDIAAALGVGAASSPAAAGSGETGRPAVDRDWIEQKVQTCASCHGDKGAAPIADYPVIAGQYKSYLVHALKAYRDGERSNPIMSAQAQGLTDARIEALADYYSRRESPLYVPAPERRDSAR